MNAETGTVNPSHAPQGADSLEVVHREPPPGHDLPTHAPGVKSTASSSANSNRGGIHAFGRCYIPYTSRGNKEVRFGSIE